MKFDEKWEEVLNPDVLRPRMAQAALFIVGFELLKDTVVDRIRRFFWRGFNENGEIIDPEYDTVLSKNKSPVYASLDWLAEQEAIDEGDRQTFERIKQCRNEIAHEMLNVLSQGLPPEFADRFSELLALLRKIEVWWIVGVDVPSDPQFDGQTINEEGIVPGPILNLRLLHDIALGPPDVSRFYYEELRKRTGQSDA